MCVEDHCSLKRIDSGKGLGSLVEASWLWITRVVDGNQRTNRSFVHGSCSSKEGGSLKGKGQRMEERHPVRHSRPLLLSALCKVRLKNLDKVQTPHSLGE